MNGKISDFMLPAPIGAGFSMDGYWVWCGSVIKGDDGKYHMFASRWSMDYPMHPGWLLESEIVHAICDRPDGKYEFRDVALTTRGSQYWDGRSVHNPNIRKVGDTYVLYYMGTTHPFTTLTEHEKKNLQNLDYRTVVARANKRIGIATSKSLNGPWKRLDKPILEPRPGEFDSFFVSNPAPCIEDDGKITLVYKCRKYKELPCGEFPYGKMELGVATADSYDGVYTHMTKEPIFDSGYEMEDPFIWHDEDGFNMMGKDMWGRICGEQFGGVYANSKDGIRWTIKKDFLFYSRDILWDDGVVRRMGNLERPYILFEEGKPSYLFFATSDGKEGEGFVNCTKTWNMVIPLKN